MTNIEQEAFNIPQVQPMAHDWILLISCRCPYREDGADENGRLYHMDGSVRGADAFAISGERALFRGGDKNQEGYHLLEFTQPMALEKSRSQLRDRRGDLIQAKRAAGRGDALFLPRDRKIFKITLGDAKRLAR